MPMVVEGSGYPIRFRRGNIVNRMAFYCELGIFWQSLIETQPKAEPVATIAPSA